MLVRRFLLSVCLVVLAVCASTLADDGQIPVRYDNYKVVRLRPSSWDQIELIHGAGGRLLSCNEGLGPVDYLVAPEALAGVAALGIPYEVLDDNIQRSIDAEREHLAASGAVSARDATWFEDYKTYGEIVAKLNAMQADHPELATVIDLGPTMENRHVWGIRISGPGSDKPAVLFDATWHAREWIAPMTTMWIADQLVYSTDPAIRALVDRVEFFLVPVNNPDGYIYTWATDRMWRKNRRLNVGGCYGVDGNRNWGTGWGLGGASSNPCAEDYRGTAAFSEPEVQALRDFIIAHPQIVTGISYHSFDQLIMSPYGYTDGLPPDNALFIALDAAMHDAILAVHGMQYWYGPIYSTIYPVSGGNVDWYYVDRGIFAFTIELRDTGAYGFVLPADQIIPTCEENFAGAMRLAEWAVTPMNFAFPNGRPSKLAPNTAQALRVKITAIGATLDGATPRLYTRFGGSGAFTESGLTSLGGGLYDALLPATPCGVTLDYYFSAATTTGVVVLSPVDAPSSVYCVPAAPTIVVLDVNMDVNPGWTAQGQWAWGTPTGGSGDHGGPDPTGGHTGTKVYGYNLTGGYANDIPEVHLTSTAIDCSSLVGTSLHFWRWLGVETPTWDHAYVRISSNGTTWTTIWENLGATIDDQAWVYQEFDISAYADHQPTVYLRWTMGPTDSAWTYCGWNIDDVQVMAADPNGCPPLKGDLNCDGGVNGQDLDGFVLALFGESFGFDEYYARYPDCNPLAGDINGDGHVNGQDIDGFVECVLGYGCP